MCTKKLIKYVFCKSAKATTNYVSFIFSVEYYVIARLKFTMESMKVFLNDQEQVHNIAHVALIRLVSFLGLLKLYIYALATSGLFVCLERLIDLFCLV